MNQLESTRINWNQPESTGINPNQSESTRINYNQLESTLISSKPMEVPPCFYPSLKQKYKKVGRTVIQPGQCLPGQLGQLGHLWPRKYSNMSSCCLGSTCFEALFKLYPCITQPQLLSSSVPNSPQSCHRDWL